MSVRRVLKTTAIALVGGMFGSSLVLQGYSHLHDMHPVAAIIEWQIRAMQPPIAREWKEEAHDQRKKGGGGVEGGSGDGGSGGGGGGGVGVGDGGGDRGGDGGLEELYLGDIPSRELLGYCSAFRRTHLVRPEALNLPFIREYFELVHGLSGAQGLHSNILQHSLSVDKIAGRRAIWVRHPGVGVDAPVVIYLHGGGYSMGTPDQSAYFADNISRMAGVRVMSLDYRLSPEHPLPHATEDVVEAYLHLVREGVKPAHIALMGDSAGGGLTLLTLQALKKRNIPLPACAVPLSAWTDLSCSGESFKSNGAVDPLFGSAVGAKPINPKMLSEFAVGNRDVEGKTINTNNPQDPKYSPLYGDFTGLPPLHFVVGSTEMLLDDTLRAVDKARAQGVKASYWACPYGFHCFPLFPTPESHVASYQIARFLSNHFNNK